MELKKYQEQAMTTCTASSKNFSYMMLNLVGEVGELASKIAKSIRKQQQAIEDNELISYVDEYVNSSSAQCKVDDEKMEAELDTPLMLEAGDVLWQLAGLCTVMGWSLEDVARINLEKLQARKEAGTISGSGDGVKDGEGRKAD